MWSRFSEVLSFDNTYKTNRFKMPLFNITGLTNINSIFNAGFGLIYTERQVEAIRIEIGAALPKVGITDYDSNLKDALNETFPNMQQQICIFHINKNVLLKVKRKWKVPPGVVDVDDEDGPDAPRLADAEADAAAAEGADESAADHEILQDLNAPARTEEQLQSSRLPAEIPHTREGVLMLWKYMAYSNSEEDFMESWARLLEEFPDQEPIIEYLQTTYLPVRHQWANCYIKKYPNFGQRVTSPTESSHKDLKSYLIHGTSSLLRLSQAMEEMIDNKRRTYQQDIARNEMRLRCAYMGREWAGQLPMHISYFAMDMIAKRYRHACAAMPTPGRDPQPLLPCTEAFSKQWGLPCSHTILQRLQMREPLDRRDVHSHWHLQRSVVSQ